MSFNKRTPFLLTIIWSKIFLIGCFLPLFVFGLFCYLRFPNELYYDLVEFLSFFVKTYIGTLGQIAQLDHGLNKIGSLLVIISIIGPLLLLLSKWVLFNFIPEHKENPEKLPNICLNKTDWVIITVLFFVAGILRIIPIDQGLWQPEIASYKCFMEQGFMATLWPKSATGPHPLMQLIGIAFTKIFGLSDFTLRFPFYLISVLSIPLLYIISLKLTANRVVATIAGILMALHSYHIFLSFQMRAYGMMAFFSIISYYYSVRLLYSPTRNIAYILTLINILLVYSQLYGLLLVTAQIISVFAIVLIEKISKQINPLISQKIFLEFFNSFVLTLFGVALLYFTHIPVIAMSLFNTEFPHDLSFVDYFIRGIRLQYHLVSMVSSPGMIYFTFGFLFVLIIMILFQFKKNLQIYMLLFSFAFTILLTISLKSGQGFYPRYMSCALPLFILLITILLHEWWTSENLLKKITSISLMASYLFISIAGYSNSYLIISPVKNALEYIDSINVNQISPIYVDEYSSVYYQWYNKNVRVITNVDTLSNMINLKNKFFLIKGISAPISLDTNCYKAILKTKKNLLLIKTLNGHFSVEIWEPNLINNAKNTLYEIDL